MRLGSPGPAPTKYTLPDIDRVKNLARAFSKEFIREGAALGFGLVRRLTGFGTDELRAIGSGDDGAEMQTAFADNGVGADGNLAASAERCEDGAFRGDGGARVGVVELRASVAAGAGFARFEREGPLADRGAHHLGWK